jgi:uncharacterized protein
MLHNRKLNNDSIKSGIIMSIYKPIQFFCITFLISSVMFFVAAYISLQDSMQYLLFPLIIGGMSGPFIATFIMFFQDKNINVWQDFYQRLCFDSMKPLYIPLVIACMPILIVCAIGISLFFGQSFNQLSFSQQAPDQVLNGFNFLGMLILFFLSSSLEEIGWRGYGIDSLRAQFNLWQTSLIFATLWSVWHVPAFFIKDGYFQQELWNVGFLYVIVYFASIYPLTVLMNWAYVKNNRSIFIVILFHMAVNISCSLVHLELPTKIILMLLLWVAAGIIVITNKQLFFTLNARE